MGERLIMYYKYINDEGGLKGKVELAMKTKLPEPKAALEKDSTEIIKLFKDAIEEITGKPAPDL